jgi:hypothetical protein
MPLRKIENIKIENIDELDEEDTFTPLKKYILMVEGYSRSSNIGFIKNEISDGNNVNEAIFRAYDKIGTNLFVNYNISIDEMMTTNYYLLETGKVVQSSGFAFYTLTEENIQEFREDEERYLMSCQDK